MARVKFRNHANQAAGASQANDGILFRLGDRALDAVAFLVGDVTRRCACGERKAR